jgi:hypothetical protein
LIYIFYVLAALSAAAIAVEFAVPKQAFLWSSQR